MRTDRSRFSAIRSLRPSSSNSEILIARIAAQEVLDGGGQVHGPEGGRRAQADAAGGRAHGPLHQFLQAARGQRQRIGIFQQEPAAFREVDVLGIAVEELDTEIAFQPGDFLGHGRTAG